MIKEINNNLNNYLEFDNNELFVNNLVRVFGGAIRDSIAGDVINDIDILCGSRSIYTIEAILESHGYIYMEKIITKDIMSLYSDINVIAEPRNWMKGNKLVQLIRPRLMIPQNKIDRVGYEENFRNLIANVDLSCCGVSYAKGILYENYRNAIRHCANKYFFINEGAHMYSQKRAIHRISKLESRGWENIKKDVQFIEDRDMKINLIMNNVVYDYEPEYLLPNLEVITF